MTVLDDRITTWFDVCAFAALTPGRGVCALLGGVQVAVFRLWDDALYAVANYDPFSRVEVLSRGIVGSKGEAPKVASPIFKQTFDLRTGVCFEEPSVVIDTYAVRVVAGRVEVGVAS